MSKFNFARFADAHGIKFEEEEDKDVLEDARIQKDLDANDKSNGKE